MPRPKMLLFDIDGTLVRTHGVGRRALDLAFHRHFQSSLYEGEASLVPFAGRTDPQILSDLVRILAIEPKHWEQVRETLLEDYFNHLKALLDPPSPEAGTIGSVEDLLPRLAARPNVTLGLLTGNLERGARIKLAPFGLNRWFQTGGFGCDATDRRIIAQVAFKRTAALAGVTVLPADTVVFGDTVFDINCAVENGFRSVGIGMNACERTLLHDAGADHVIASYKPPASILDWIDSL